VDSKPKQDAEPPSNIASTQSHGPCHDKKSERDGNGASTQSRGLCHDKKSKRVTFNKQEKDAVLLYSFLSKHTQHSNHYKEEPLQKHCCTDLGNQSKLIFTSEKTTGCQQLTLSANSEGGRLASLLLSGHKSVGIQPTSLKTAQRAIGSKCKSFQDNVSIDSWKCRMEINRVKSMKTAQRAIGSKCKSFLSRGHCYDKKSERVGNSASTQLVGFCHDKKSERVGNRAFTQLVGSCHDKKSERAGCIASTQQDPTFQLIVGFKQYNQSSTRKSRQCRSLSIMC